MLKFKTSCAVLACLSSNLLNEVGLSLFRYFEVGLHVCDIVVKKFTFAISSPDELLCLSMRLFVPEDMRCRVRRSRKKLVINLMLFAPQIWGQGFLKFFCGGICKLTPLPTYWPSLVEIPWLIFHLC